jgi:hypothetical protein
VQPGEPGEAEQSAEPGEAEQRAEPGQPAGPGRAWAAPALAALALVVGFGGLASSWGINPGIDPALRTERDSYRAGETVEVRLEAGVRELGYNLCASFLTLERADEGLWVAAPVSLFPEPSETGGAWVCPAPMYQLPPGGIATGVVRLPPDLAPGLYRLTHDVEVMESRERRTLATAPFRVEA